MARWKEGCHLIGDDVDYLYYRHSVADTVEIVELAVTSERRVGRGRAMVEELKNRTRGHCKSIYVFTRYSNWIAREFYEAIGFKLGAFVRGMYKDGSKEEEDAALFIMEL